jgi:hypothetical protein
MIIIEVSERERRGKFEARCEGRLLCTSRQPFLDSARALLADGMDPAEVIVMRHHGSTTDALRSTVGAAARLTVEERDFGRPRFGPWRADTRGFPSPEDH